MIIDDSLGRINSEVEEDPNPSIAKFWNLTCMNRYFDSLAKARKNAREIANLDNIEDLKGFGPREISTEMWDTLIDT